MRKRTESYTPRKKNKEHTPRKKNKEHTYKHTHSASLIFSLFEQYMNSHALLNTMVGSLAEYSTQTGLILGHITRYRPIVPLKHPNTHTHLQADRYLLAVQRWCDLSEPWWKSDSRFLTSTHTNELQVHSFSLNILSQRQLYVCGKQS